MSKEKHTLRDGIIIGMVVTVVGGVVLAIITQRLDNIWNFILNVARIVWNYLTSLIYIPAWLFWVLILSCIYTIIRSVIQFFRSTSSDIDFHLYTSDTFYGVTWHWDYYSNRIDSDSIYGVCPTCQARLIGRNDYSHKGTYYCFVCRRCDSVILSFEEQRFESLERIVIEIERSIRNGDWIKTLQKQGIIDPPKKDRNSK